MSFELLKRSHDQHFHMTSTHMSQDMHSNVTGPQMMMFLASHNAKELWNHLTQKCDGIWHDSMVIEVTCKVLHGGVLLDSS